MTHPLRILFSFLVFLLFGKVPICNEIIEPFQVNDSLPNLSAQKLKLKDEFNDFRGRNLSIKKDIKNDIAASWTAQKSLNETYEVKLYLSSDDTISNNDLLLQTYVMDSDSKSYGRSYSSGIYIYYVYNFDLPIVIPESVPLGEYYLILIVDPDDRIKQRYEDFNRSTLPIRLVDGSLPLPDLHIFDFFINIPSTYIKSNTYRKVSNRDENLFDFIRLTNSGNVPSPTFDVGLFISTDRVLSSDDIKIYSESVQNIDLNPNEIIEVYSQNNDVFSDEILDGIYQLLIVVDPDNLIDEYDEENNIYIIEMELRNKFDEVLLTPGKGGPYIIDARSTSSEYYEQNQVISSSLTYGRDGFRHIHKRQHRGSYPGVGDLNKDNKKDFVFTYGPMPETPIESPYLTPNQLLMKGNRRVGLWSLSYLNHSFAPFPYGDENPVQYKGGELRTAIGNFLKKDDNLIAVAQGFGSQLGLVRLIKNTGLPAPNGWEVVSQFQPLDDRPTQNNANGGVTLAAGDMDGDGFAELLAGQTNSQTSLTQFSTIDIDESGRHIRHNYTAFPPGYRGLGGIEIAVADLNGDGKNEIVAVGKGYAGTTDIGNVISVIEPVIENQTIVGYTRPTTPVIKVVDDSVNPGGGLSIAAGEFDGIPENGQEIVIGSGNGAPRAFYRLLKIQYDLDEDQNGNVNGFYFLNGAPNDASSVVPAFHEDLNPKSGEVYVNAADVIR